MPYEWGTYASGKGVLYPECWNALLNATTERYLGKRTIASFNYNQLASGGLMYPELLDNYQSTNSMEDTIWNMAEVFYGLGNEAAILTLIGDASKLSEPTDLQVAGEYLFQLYKILNECRQYTVTSTGSTFLVSSAWPAGTYPNEAKPLAVDYCEVDVYNTVGITINGVPVALGASLTLNTPNSYYRLYTASKGVSGYAKTMTINAINGASQSVVKYDQTGGFKYKDW